MRVRSGFVRVCLAALLALLPAAQQAHAQDEGGGVPQELTVSELRQVLEVLLAFDRQRALFGLPSLGGAQAVTVQLLQADFDENVLPGLMFAEQDCFFAEVPVGKALEWGRQVQLLALDDENGPLYEEAAVVQESVGKILVHCHKQLYEACVLNDDDPNAEFLPGITRQLGLLGFEDDYEAKTRRCQQGWNGKVTIAESLQGSMSKTESMGGSSVTTKVVMSGTRNFKVELLSKGNAIGQAEGRSQQVDTSIASAGQCTTTIEMTGLRTASGSGEAVLRKLGSPSGKFTISFTGPREEGRQTTSGLTTYSNSKCGTNSSLPGTGVPTPPTPWPGLIADTLSDPLSEVIKGSKTLTFAVNAAGVPVAARPDQSGGVSRIPAIPGAPQPGAGLLDAALPSTSQLLPWLGASVRPDLDGEPPVVTMQIDWELVFGGGI